MRHTTLLFSVLLIGALVFLPAACGARHLSSGADKKAAVEPDAAVANGPVLTKKSIVALSFVTDEPKEDNTPQIRVVISITNEIGASTPRNVGVFDGSCEQVEIPNSALGAKCWWKNKGVLLKFVSRHGQLYVLRAWMEVGLDEVEYDEVQRFELPKGAAIEFATPTS